MAAARPVLANRLPGVMRDVPAENGVCYASLEAWGQLVRKMQDAAYRSEIGGQGRAFVEANCDWEQLTDTFEAHLQRVVRGNQ